MNYGSIYHRTSDNYCYPYTPNDLIVNLKTGYDVERVFIYYGDPFSGGILGGDWKWQGTCEEIVFKKRLPHHLWWTTTLKPEFKRCKYYFRLETAEESIYYFEDGFYTEEEINSEGKLLSCFTFPWMNPADLNVTPEWVNETVWYQIFPERFCNGNPENDPAGTKPWKYEEASHYDFYGGDLQGVESKLHYLNKLGVNGLYFTPLFEADSNHKYDTTDYKKVDPHFGTTEDLQRLVKEAHKLGIRVMFDGVFNHCGQHFAPWKDVLQNGPASEYYDWFMINKWPFDIPLDNTRNGEYYSFAFAGNMPKLNTNNPQVIDYFTDIVTYWIDVFDIDGLRLDVANEISHKFCKKLRQTVKALKPDFYILGEIWHDSIGWLCGDEFDSVMNYPLAASIQDFWIYKDKPKEYFEHAINRNYTMYMQQTNDALFNLMDSHDTNRLYHKTGGDLDIFYQQLALLFTMPGSPCIYYGTEIAMDGSHDPDCRRCMPWDEIEAGSYDEQFAQMQTLISLRKTHETFRSKHFHFTNEIPDPRVIEYMKLTDTEVLKVIVNASETAIPLTSYDKILYSRNYADGILAPKGICIYS